MKLSTINFLVALKNASIANKTVITIKGNPQILQLLTCLYNNAFVLSFNYCKKQKQIKIFFKVDQALNFFNHLKIMATSSCGSYIKYLDLCKILYNYKILIVSTTKGLLTGEACKRYKIGGKLLLVS